MIPTAFSTLRRSVLLAALLVMCSASCTSPPPQLGELYLTTTGDGVVTVVYFVGNGVCDAGTCIGGLDNAGSTDMAYVPGSDVTFIARPFKGWRFVAWKLTVYGRSGPSDHSYVTVASGDSTYVAHDTGQQMDVFALFETMGGADASSDGGLSPDVDSSCDAGILCRAEAGPTD